MLNKLMNITLAVVCGVGTMFITMSGFCLYLAGNHIVGTLLVFAAVYGPAGAYLLVKLYDQKRGKHFAKWSQQ